MTTKKDEIKGIVTGAWRENTILAVVIIAFLVFIANAIVAVTGVSHPFVDRVQSVLYPSFLVVVLFELYSLRTKIAPEVADIHHQIHELRRKFDEEFSYLAFASGNKFDEYLEERFRQANDVKVIHISSGTSDKRQQRGYYEILDTFIQRGGKFTRIFSDTSNEDVFRWIREDLVTYKGNNYFIHFLEDIKLADIKTIGIMIIDEKEVCLGGGYDTEFATPTLSIRNAVIVKFFLDYFNYLRLCAKPVRAPGKNINLEILNSRISRDPN